MNHDPAAPIARWSDPETARQLDQAAWDWNTFLDQHGSFADDLNPDQNRTG